MTTANRGSLIAFVSVTTLFFAWGFITNLIDPLIPAVMKVFGLEMKDAVYTQFAFFISYGVFSLPAGLLVAKLGYSRTILVALLFMTLACLIFPASTHLNEYGLMLGALFILGGGITVLQVAANPLSAALGDPKTSHSRLVLSQAFNSLGTVFGPFVGSMMMLSGGMFAASAAGADLEAARVASLRRIDSSFLMVAGALVVLMFFMWLQSKRINDSAPPAQAEKFSIGAVLRSKWAMFGGLGIFLYVGAEVAIASVMINFLQRDDVIAHLLHGEPTKLLGLFTLEGESAERAGKMLSVLYWGGAMVGRFAGSYLLRSIKASHLLAVFAAILCLVVSQSTGELSAYAALSVGLVNSIMFPAIFTITLERSTASVATTSGLLCMSIVGGAFIPKLFTEVAAQGQFHVAYFVPLVCYALIVVFAIASAKARVVSHGTAPSSGH